MTAAERYDAWQKAERKRDTETPDERRYRLILEVDVCKDMHEEAQRSSDAERCAMTGQLLSNAKMLLSMFAMLDGVPVVMH